MLDILGVYEKCSGQQINRSKTTIYFSKSTSEERRFAIIELLGVPEIREYGRYLGLPSFVGKKKKQASIILRSVFGENYKVGGKNYSLKRVGKF